MKVYKNFITVCLISVLITGVASGYENNSGGDTISVKSESVYYTSEDSVCSVSIIYPVLSGVKDKPVEEKVNTFLKIEFLDSPEWLDINNCDHEIGFTYESDYSIKYISLSFICIQQFIYEYSGGAHGNYGLYSFNIDLSNGELITLKEIILPDKFYSLSEIAVQTLLSDFDAETLVDAGLFEDTLSILPEQDFFITPGHLVLQFDPYEIASYAMGEIQIKIPFEKIKELLKPELPFALK